MSSRRLDDQRVSELVGEFSKAWYHLDCVLRRASHWDEALQERCRPLLEFYYKMRDLNDRYTHELRSISDMLDLESNYVPQTLYERTVLHLVTSSGLREHYHALRHALAEKFLRICTE